MLGVPVGILESPGPVEKRPDDETLRRLLTRFSVDSKREGSESIAMEDDETTGGRASRTLVTDGFRLGSGFCTCPLEFINNSSGSDSEVEHNEGSSEVRGTVRAIAFGLYVSFRFPVSVNQSSASASLSKSSTSDALVYHCGGSCSLDPGPTPNGGKEISATPVGLPSPPRQLGSEGRMIDGLDVVLFGWYWFACV